LIEEEVNVIVVLIEVIYLQLRRRCLHDIVVA
jgi:hypothetical protein